MNRQNAIDALKLYARELEDDIARCKGKALGSDFHLLASVQVAIKMLTLPTDGWANGNDALPEPYKDVLINDGQQSYVGFYSRDEDEWIVMNRTPADVKMWRHLPEVPR